MITMKQLLQNCEKEIDEKNLNQEYYFQAFINEAYNKNLLTQLHMERIQRELFELMGREVIRYTNGESSSVPIEKAEKLLNSITYIIGFSLKEEQDIRERLRLLENEKIQSIFYRGMDRIAVRRKKAYSLLCQIQGMTQEIDNIAYKDTIKRGLNKFFHDYNIEFAAYDIPADIDYPLLFPVKEYVGFEYVEEYLYKLYLENLLTARFDSDRINLLLQGFDREAEHMLINLYELVLINILGCQLLEKDIFLLEVTTPESGWLNNKLKKISGSELSALINSAWEEIRRTLQTNEEENRYAEKALQYLMNRIRNNLQTDTLSKLFLAFPTQAAEEQEILELGEQMTDEILRSLIQRIGEISDVKEKVRIIKTEVHSMDDLAELLDTCFLEEEYLEVFSMLGEAELLVLTKYVRSELGGRDIFDEDIVKPWQSVLLSRQKE